VETSIHYRQLRLLTRAVLQINKKTVPSQKCQGTVLIVLKVLSLPIFPEMRGDEVEMVTKVLLDVA